MRPNGRYLEIYFAGCRSQLVFDNHNAAVVRFSAAMSFQSRSTEEGQRCRYRETRLASVLLDALFESPKEGLRAHGLSWIHEFTFKHSTNRVTRGSNPCGDMPKVACGELKEKYGEYCRHFSFPNWTPPWHFVLPSTPSCFDFHQ